ncbi:methyltransferase-like protein 7A isoform X2 [Amphibalanus amphitrite]|uniref:methyltransferase-like protein 7A isoform X2 n=1 Tax=Amphibalanus amphitrite TaxID=1232801 RepID=UPI001C8FB532|nr:methyltransferase-like protein 7A isoform X2 [Amphibalanus amphitrite]
MQAISDPLASTYHKTKMFLFLLCLANSLACITGWLLIIVVTIKVLVGPTRFQEIRNWLYANLVEFVMKDRLKGALNSTKADLFSSMASLKSFDNELSKKNALVILEIGVGTGTNLGYYPAGSRLHCVDPNQAFEVYFRRECLQKAAHLDPDIRFVAERGESMPSVADSSVDVVVTTKVLCSVTHLDQMFREIRRVLVPGGKFYFLEHVAHPSGTWRRCVQNALSNSGIWPAVFDGCMINLEFRELLSCSGFSSVDYHSVLVMGKGVVPVSTPLQGLGIVNPFAFGVATK